MLPPSRAEELRLRQGGSDDRGNARRFSEFLCGRGDGPPTRRSPTDPSAWRRPPSKVRHTINQGALGAAFAGHPRQHQCRRRRSEGPRRLRRRHLPRRHAPRAGRALCLRGTGAAGAARTAAPLAIAIDPLDGSSNIDTNVSIGTIFSLLPATGAPDADPAAAFLQAGANQLGAGFFIYGPQLALVLSLGSGTHVFVFSARLGTFVQAYESRIIPPRTQEFAINASNYRHWDEAVRLYVDDCLKGAEGPRERDFNMRWIASLVAEATAS